MWREGIKSARQKKAGYPRCKQPSPYLRYFCYLVPDQRQTKVYLYMFDESDIWVRFCAGEKGAFRELYDQHYTRMFVWGCKWLKGEEAFVRDTLHDFFIYLWERRSRLGSI